MIRCILVDDEEIILSELRSMVEKSKQVQLVGAFTDPFQALESIKVTIPEVVFLDIEMPELNGIELAKKIQTFNNKIQIVFITAYEQYALKAFEVRALHYLLKPITQEKMDVAVSRVIRIVQINTYGGNIKIPTFAKDKSGKTDRICVKDRDNILIIKIIDIIYLKSESGKIVIVTRKGSFKSRIGLQFWETKLNEFGFLRCHRSFIVNVAYISKLMHILGEYKELELDYCDVNIPISRQKVALVKQWLGII